MTSGIQIEINEALIKQVLKLPLMIQKEVIGKCLAAYSKPIANKTEILATSSVYTKSRYPRVYKGKRSGGWSLKYSSNPKWSGISSLNHAGYKVGRYGMSTWIGFQYPKGNKQQFVHPIKKGDSYKRYNWGIPGVTYTYMNRFGTVVSFVRNTPAGVNKFPIKDRPTIRAYHRAKSASESAFLNELKKQTSSLVK